MITNINYADGLLEEGMSKDALAKYQELLGKVSKRLRKFINPEPLI